MRSESPFFLLTEDMDRNVSYCWWNDEDNMKEDAVERRGSGERIICAIEISSCRDIEIPSDLQGILYTEVDDVVNGYWKSKVIKELVSAGFNVDMSELIKTI